MYAITHSVSPSVSHPSVSSPAIHSFIHPFGHGTLLFLLLHPKDCSELLLLAHVVPVTLYAQYLQ